MAEVFSRSPVWKLIIPRYLRSCLTFADFKIFTITSTRSVSGLIPSEECDFVRAEFTFLAVYHYTVIVETVEQDSQIFAMLFSVFRSYEKVINVRVDEIETMCDFVDKSLTCLRGVPKSKHHVGCFDKSERCRYRGFLDCLQVQSEFDDMCEQNRFLKRYSYHVDVARSLRYVAACTCWVRCKRSMHDSRYIVVAFRPSSRLARWSFQTPL